MRNFVPGARNYNAFERAGEAEARAANIVALLAADRIVERQLAQLDDATLAACSDPDQQLAWWELHAETLERLVLIQLLSMGASPIDCDARDRTSA